MVDVIFLASAGPWREYVTVYLLCEERRVALLDHTQAIGNTGLDLFDRQAGLLRPGGATPPRGEAPD